MPRELSEPIATANAADDTETHDVMDIVLPLQLNEIEPLVLYLGTGKVEVGEITYLPKLRSMFSITYSRGNIPDGGEFTITNLSNQFGPTFLKPARIMDGATVVVYRAFRRATPPGAAPATWTLDEIGHGILRTRQIAKGEVRASFVPDMSNSMVSIGGDALTQRCLKVFNVNGNHPLGGPCGWQPAQGGDPLSCDHVFDSPNGCLGHNNQFRCGCVPPLSKTQIEVATGPTPGTPSEPFGGFGPDRFPHRPLEFDPDFRNPF